MAVDTPNPAEDVFYRETLKALGKELRTIASQGMEQNRLTGKLVDVAGELVGVAKDLRDVVREIKDELAQMRADRADRAERRERRHSSVPPVAVARTKSG